MPVPYHQWIYDKWRGVYDNKAFADTLCAAMLFGPSAPKTSVCGSYRIRLVNTGSGGAALDSAVCQLNPKTAAMVAATCD